MFDICVSRRGVTRWVALIGPWAFKLPRIDYGWRLFLSGLICNIQEREIGTLGVEGVCPVVWSIPGGWLNVMARARQMTDDEFEAFDARSFCERPDYHIPAELKADSFGWVDGKVVAIDYG